MEKFNRLLIAFILMAFMACQKDNSGSATPNTPPLSDTLRIKVGETVTTPDFSIKLDSASDSRCAPDVQCIWAGVAHAKVVVKKDNNSEIARFVLDPTNKNTVDKITVFNRRLHLINVFLQPNSNIPNDYFIQLIVE